MSLETPLSQGLTTPNKHKTNRRTDGQTNTHTRPAIEKKIMFVQDPKQTRERTEHRLGSSQTTYELIVRNRKHPYGTAIYKLTTDWLKNFLSIAGNGQ